MGAALALMRCLAIFGLPVVAKLRCAGALRWSVRTILSSVQPLTTRQITARADGLQTLRSEPGGLRATERPSMPQPTSPRNLRATNPRREVPLPPSPLSHAEGDRGQMPWFRAGAHA